MFLVIAALLMQHDIGYAQSPKLLPDETADRAIKIASQIEADDLIVVSKNSLENLNLENLNNSEKLRKLRWLTMDSAVLRNYAPLSELLPVYRKEANKQKSSRDIAIARIIELQEQLQKTDVSEKSARTLLTELQDFQNHSDWLVAQRAVLMEAILPSINGNFDVALRDTQKALKMIPTELSPDVLEAQYEAYDQIAFLQLSLNNIDLGVVTTEQVIEKGIAQNRYIDGIGLVSNLVYGFNSWHEFETAEKLSNVLFRLSQKSETNVKSIAYFRLGQAQNNAGHYKAALDSLNIAAQDSKSAKFMMSIELARSLAFAGLSRTTESEESLSKYIELKNETDVHRASHQERILHIHALNALHNSDSEKVVDLLNQRLKSVVQLQLSRQSKGIQSLQANLENDKNRQSEREAALRRETQLKQSELEAKQRSNMFLMALAGLLLFIAFAALAFAMWREKISKILQVAAHEAEAGDRAKSQFLSVMSHELRTPLNGIIGIAGILSERGETEELRNYNKLILKSGQNLLELLSGILDMAQMESDKLKIITAPASIQQIVEGLYQAAKAEIDSDNIEFTCFIADDIPESLMLDSIRVKQALSNLISNAVRFTNQGRIHIHVTLGEPGRRGVRDLTMIVADTGQGIAEETQAKLFKPFAQADSSLTRDHDGAGIGLAVTRGLSRLMGGDVTMTSKQGRGSEFTMVIKTCDEANAKIDPETNRRVFEIEPSAEPKIDFAPAVSLEKLRANAAEKESQKLAELAATDSRESSGLDDMDDVEFETISEAPATRSPEETEIIASLDVGKSTMDDNTRSGFTRKHPRSDEDDIAPDQLNGLNVLIVEDVAANQEVLRSLLEPVGCVVSCAEHGQKALEIMETQIFDAVIMDIRMPIMDGIQTTKAIRSLDAPHRNVAIVALTADASAENNAECLAAGADVFLTKPVVVSELFSSIRFARRKQYRQKLQALSA